MITKISVTRKRPQRFLSFPNLARRNAFLSFPQFTRKRFFRAPSDVFCFDKAHYIASSIVKIGNYKTRSGRFSLQ